MMYHNSIAIAITNEDKKPYREYEFKKLHDKCKTSEVILPFDSHYQLLIKNDNSTRIKLDIDIDGTIITGSGLIIPASSQHYIERFVESAKKLYFTKKTNEKVADPTNKENGFLTIKVGKEKYQPYAIHNIQPWVPYPPHVVWNYPYMQGWDTQNYNHRVYRSLRDEFTNNSALNLDSTPVSYCSSSEISSSTTSAHGSLSLNGVQTLQGLDTGATVEGDASNQSFTTTQWVGEEVGSDFIFQFKMLGQEVKLSAAEEKDLMEYKRLKAKFEGK